MDASRFDALSRHWAKTGSRRAALGALAGFALTLLLPVVGQEAADARRGKKKRKRKPLERNAFGCVDVGKACAGKDTNCCSGICQGRKPKKGKKDTSRCVAHHTGGCQPEQDLCTGGLVPCGAGGICYRTTGQGSFCGIGGVCDVCAKDADCEDLGYAEGAACLACDACLVPITACSNPAA